MDAVEFLKAKNQMCISVQTCSKCLLDEINNTNNINCFDEGFEEKAVAIVEKWAKEHPIKTRQSEFLKLFPNAVIRDSCVDIKPCEVDAEFECPDRNTVSCGECKQRYWNEEVE